MRWIFRRVRNALKYARAGLADLGMLQKVTLAFFLAILVPAASIGLYTYVQMTRYSEEEIVKNTNATLIQIKDNIHTKVLFASRIGESLAYNSNILNFLENEFIFNPDTLNYYLEAINPMVTYAMEFEKKNIDNINIYTNNPSITETKFFLSYERIRDQSWFNSQNTDYKKDLWLNHKQFNPFSAKEAASSGKPVFTLVKGIYSIGNRFLGIILLDIAQDKMLSSLDNYTRETGEIFAVDSRYNVIYPTGIRKDAREPRLFRENLLGGSGFFKDGDDMYVYQSVDSLNIRIVSKMPLEGLIRESRITSRNVMLIIFFGVMVFGFLIYLLIKSIFSKLKQMVNIMNTVSEGRFDNRIPVTRKDEIGQLARDFNILIEKIDEQVKDILHRETAQKNAQILALQYQINPHFMYNMVDTFNMKMELTGNYDTAEAIARFGKMLRYNMSSSCVYASLKDEVGHVENYISIQKLRYDERIRLNVNLPADLARFSVIKFLLQPIVENSIKHGLKGRKSTLTVSIEFEVSDECLVISVTDDGNGMGAAELERLNTELASSQYDGGSDDSEGGIGLMNINNRIKLFYGERYHIRLESVEGRFTRAVIRLPYIDSKG